MRWRIVGGWSGVAWFSSPDLGIIMMVMKAYHVQCVYYTHTHLLYTTIKPNI
jgi:hypothetical protein